MTVKQAATYRGCSVQRILQLIHKKDSRGKPAKNRLRASKVNGSWSIKLKDLAAISPLEDSL